jgi:hypothetical protein
LGASFVPGADRPRSVRSGPVFPVRIGKRAGQEKRPLTSYAKRLRRDLIRAEVWRLPPVEVPATKSGTQQHARRRTPMDKYIGLDVHATSCTAAVVDARGKRLGSHVIETNGQALVEFFKAQAGTLHVCLEEGTQATWLAEIMSPHLAEVKVVHVSESRGQKSDEHDAFGLAEGMRTGRLDTSVFKYTGTFTTLRQLVKTHRMVVQDTVRVQNRLRALFRARGVQIPGKHFSRGTRGREGVAVAPKALYENLPTQLADEVARAIAWIASPEASFVTGAVLPVNGGMCAA